MKFEFIDQNVSSTMNGFIIIANILNLLYNIPQIIHTYKIKSTKDFSSWFISLRIIGNSIWIAYSVEIGSLLMLINNIVTVFSSVFVGYYKVCEIIEDYKTKKIDDKIDDKIDELKIVIQDETELLNEDIIITSSDIDLL